MSLRFRLNLLITVVMLIFMVAVAFVVIKGLRTSTQEGIEASTRVTVQLLDTVIISSEQNPSWGYTHVVMQRFLEHLKHVRGTRISLYDMQGNLLYQSPPSSYRAGVNPPDWFVKILTPNEPSVMREINFGKLVVDPASIGSIREAWVNMLDLFWVGMVFFVLLNVMVYWMLGRWLKPVQPMLQAMNQMEQGDLSTRLPEFELPEFARIAQNFNRMGESLQASTEENRRLALIVKQTADAIMIHDLDGNISFWNPAAQRMFGYAPEDIIGKSVSLLTPVSEEAGVESDLREINAGRKVENHDSRRQARDGRVIDVSISAAPLIDPVSGKVIGDICSMRDITERKQAEEAERQLEENRQLTHLIQRHIEDERRSLARELHDELGQYVTAIKTFAVGISNKTQEKMPDIASNAQTIVAAANHIYDGMHNIIRQLRPGSLDNLGLSETLRDLVSSYRQHHPNLKIKLVTKGEVNSLGEVVNINIYRVVQEAVNNALKHSNANAIEIKLEVSKTGELQLMIKDNGHGMDFCKIDHSQHFGLLGMRERAQALQGTFNIDSVLDKGTTIHINIPKGQQA
jgi:two-component system sensor histidine kinase UhpB